MNIGTIIGAYIKMYMGIAYGIRIGAVREAIYKKGLGLRVGRADLRRNFTGREIARALRH